MRAHTDAPLGARNPTLMRMLAERLSVETADAIGWSSQAIEAQAFVYLGCVRSMACRPHSRRPLALSSNA